MSRHCAIYLHAHVPWVRHSEKDHCLEEDWLHLAVLETYLPLLDTLHRLREEEVPWKLTMDLSPTLTAMLQDRHMKRRTLGFFDRTLSLARAEAERGEAAGYSALAKRYLDRIQDLRVLYMDRWQGDLIRAFTDLRDSGHLEIAASAATHGVLPLLMRVPEAVQAQVRVGVRQYVKAFGRMPHGFWLPECAYAPVLADVIRDAGIDWTVVEEHGMAQAPHADKRFPHLPGVTANGLVVLGRDQSGSGQVWNADSGYPGDDRYRDFMRDVGLEASLDDLRDYLGDREDRQFTGLKYYRASRSGGESELYDPVLAAKAVEEHASHFLNSRGAQLSALEDGGVENPVSVCAFDADFFGHWWYEGIAFLEQVFRKGARRQDFQFSTIGERVALGGERPLVTPVSSSWGEGGYFETWTTGENDWVHEEVNQRAEQLARLVKMIEENQDDIPDGPLAHRKRCLRQMTRELLLSQSSDWGFLLRNESSSDYAEERVRGHLARFDEVWKLFAGVEDKNGRLEELEKATPLFEDVPWNIFEPYQQQVESEDEGEFSLF